ncbi:MAG: hypothetical protein LUC98_01830 [Lachnospiraceae bacterium]|nr:hypothetical protein [Lachnospiraceae bacterium]
MRNMLETRTRLLKLKDKYRVILQRELLIARANKTKGIKNSANYSRIGVAYYSLNIVDSALARLQELSTNEELYESMNEMSALLGTINGMSGRVGKIDPKGVLGGLKKMSGSSSGAGKDLINTLSALSGTDVSREDGVDVGTLVSADMIERLINGESVEACLNAREGIVQDTDELMTAFGNLDELLAGDGSAPENTNESIEDITKNIDDLLNQL